MKKLFIAVFILLNITNTLAQTEWHSGSFESARSLAEKEDKVVLLLLTQDSR